MILQDGKSSTTAFSRHHKRHYGAVLSTSRGVPPPSNYSIITSHMILFSPPGHKLYNTYTWAKDCTVKEVYLKYNFLAANGPVNLIFNPQEFNITLCKIQKKTNLAREHLDISMECILSKFYQDFFLVLLVEFYSIL